MVRAGQRQAVLLPRFVNTKVDYSLNPDGSIKVVSSGNEFFTGARRPRSPAPRCVAFCGRQPSATPPGNYWIVDLGSDYAIVTDRTGRSGFILSRSPP